jgi:hypothetical protein
VFVLIGVRQAAEVIEQEQNAVTPRLERVESVLKAGKRCELTLQLQGRMGYTVRVLGHHFHADRWPSEV